MPSVRTSEGRSFVFLLAFWNDRRVLSRLRVRLMADCFQARSVCFTTQLRIG